MREEASLFKNKPRKTLVYLAFILVAGFVSLILAITQSPSFLYKIPLDWVPLLLFTAAHVFTESYYIPLGQKGRFSVSFVVVLAALIIFDVPTAMFIGLLGHSISTIFVQKRHWSIALFNGSQYMIAYHAAGRVLKYVLLSTSTPFLNPGSMSSTFQFSVQLIIAGLFACLTYLIINIPLVNGYFAMRDSHTLKEFVLLLFNWQQDKTEVYQVLFFYPLAVLVAYFYRINFVFSFFLLIPMIQTLMIHRKKSQIEKHKALLEQLYKLIKELTEIGSNESQATLSSRDLFKALLQNTTYDINDIMGSQRCSIYRVERAEEAEDTRIIHEISSPTLLEPEKKYNWLESGVLQKVAKREVGSLLNQFVPTEGYQQWKGYSSLLLEPIKATDNALYIIVFFHTNPSTFTSETQQVLRLLTQQLGVILKNYQLHNKIQEQAIKDGLMGVFNHRYLKLKMEEELSRAKRYKKPLSLIIADVDYFKKFNDTHGHLLGDKVLKEVARILEETVRETDIVARYGGEELAILLPETALQAACEVAERIRSNIAKYPFTGKDNKMVSLSVSIGVNCTDDDPNLQVSELIVRADTALYKAKNQGRNQICKAIVVDGKLIIETYAKGDSPKAPDKPTTPPEAAIEIQAVPANPPEESNLLPEQITTLVCKLARLSQPGASNAMLFYSALLESVAEALQLKQAALFYLVHSNATPTGYALTLHQPFKLVELPRLCPLPSQLVMQDPQIMNVTDAEQLLEMPHFCQQISPSAQHFLLIPIPHQGNLSGLLLGVVPDATAIPSHKKWLWPTLQALMTYALAYHQQNLHLEDSAFLFFQQLIEHWQNGLPDKKHYSRNIGRLASKISAQIPQLSSVWRESLRKTSYVASAFDYQAALIPSHQALFFNQTNLNMLNYLEEHWDGSGYPNGLKEDEIPLDARILSLVKDFEHLRRQSAMNPLSAIENLKKTGYYDPHLCYILEQVIQHDLNTSVA